MSAETSEQALSPIPMGRKTGQCPVCNRLATHCNYGVFSCNACKMFAHRITQLHIHLECKGIGNCTATDSNGALKCKHCRFQKCLAAGMVNEYIETKRYLEKEGSQHLASTIQNLLCLDKRRTVRMRRCFNATAISLDEIVGGERLTLTPRRRAQISSHDWSYWGIYTSIDFFLAFDLMQELDHPTKIKLLHAFSAKASLFAGAMRAFNEKRSGTTTVDGTDVFPQGFSLLFPINLLNGIRSRLVARLLELKITHEEFVLINAIFFCNPVVANFDAEASSIITKQQNKFTTVLSEYCRLMYSGAASARYVDLLFLLDTINRTFRDVQQLTMMFKMMQPGVQLRQLVNDVIDLP